MFRPLLCSFLFATAAFAGETHNTLTAAEKTAGWRLLFDGTTTKGWHAIGKTELPPAWQAIDGELRLIKDSKLQGGDIVTDAFFTDFDVIWEWNIAEGGNSGLKYNLPNPKVGVGCEYQMLDDERNSDAKVRNGEHRTAALYDLIPPPADKVYHPAGEWNLSRVTVKGNHVVQYLNGKQTVSFDFGSPALKELIDASKFKSVKGWGEKIASPLLLQDHGANVAVRSIKILTSGAPAAGN